MIETSHGLETLLTPDSWEAGDVAIWDNRLVNHSATFDAYVRRPPRSPVS